MANLDDVDLAYGKLNSGLLALLTKDDYDFLSDRLCITGASERIEDAQRRELLASFKARGFLMNNEKEMKAMEKLLRECNVPAAELVKTYLEQYAWKLEDDLPISFAELKVKLSQKLLAKDVYTLGTLFEFNPQELDEIQKHPAPAIRLLDKLCSKNIIVEYDVSPLSKALKTINHYAAEATIVRYEEHKMLSFNNSLESLLTDIQPTSFEELKIRLNQMLAASHVYELGTLLKFNSRELNKIQKHPAPAIRLLDKLCSKNIKAENEVSRLMESLKTMNEYTAADVVEKYEKYKTHGKYNEKRKSRGALGTSCAVL